jgi:uncharacterized membrane protein
MKIKLKTVFLFILISALFSSCYYDKNEVLYGVNNVDCTTISAKYSTDISTIISTKCATSGCHNSSAAGGLVLQNYTQVKNSVGKINTRVLVTKDMPPGSPLSSLEMDKLKCWIQSGALNN